MRTCRKASFLVLTVLGFLTVSGYGGEQKRIPTLNPFASIDTEGAKIFAVSGYTGEDAGIQIDQSGHEATLMRVTVNSPNPVALILSAYEPTIWQIEWTPQTQILAVAAVGYHAQMINGLQDGTPTITREGDFLDVESYEGVEKLDALSKRYFKRSPDAAVNASRGRTIVGNALPTGSKVITNREFRKEDFHMADAPLAGQAGLDEAERKGLIRRATQENLQIYLDNRADKAGIPPHLRPKNTSDSMLPGMNRYVVVSPDFVIPNGLYGAHSVTFLLPQGMQMPKGEKGHCSFIFMETGEAFGPGAR